MKPQALLILLTMVAGTGQAFAGTPEKNVDLGPVNGTVRHNQVVEAVRTLPDPVLFEANTQETPAMPALLIIRNARAEDGGDGALLLKQEQQMPVANGQTATLGLKARVRLWVNGEAVGTTYRTQGADIILPLPEGAKTLALRADGPLTLLFPKSYRGELNMALETEGWRDAP